MVRAGPRDEEKTIGMDAVPRLPPLAAVRAFHALGRVGSLRAAAAALNVTHTAVARQVRALEAWLGVALVETTARGTRLNARGRRFHQAVSEAFGLIADATHEIRPPGQTEELRICAAPGFATFWLLPRLHEIQARMPTVAFEIMPLEAERFDRNRFDLEVRYGERADPLLTHLPLVRPRMVALASADWLAARPGLRHARDLLGETLVHERLTDVWRDWFAACGVPAATLRGPRVGTLTTVLEAVHLGQGPGLFAEIFVDAPLTRGKLVRVVPEAPRLDRYVLTMPRDRAAQPHVRQFAAWLQDSLAAARREEAAEA